MSYRIIVQRPAKEDALEYAAFILSESKSKLIAARWLDTLEIVIRSLSDMPERFKLIDEHQSFDTPLRQVLHHSHRVIYHVNVTTKTVHILRVYHGAKRPLNRREISLD